MNVRELASRFAQQIPMSAGRINTRLKRQSEEGCGGSKRDRDMSHSAKGGDILNLCCVGHVEVGIFKSAECPLLLLEKIDFSKACPDSVAPSEFSSAGAKFTLLGYLALASLFALSQSPKRVPADASWNFHAPHSRAINVPYIVHLPRPGKRTNCCLSCTFPLLEQRDNPYTTNFVIQIL
jgi:hypothetical protein